MIESLISLTDGILKQGGDLQRSTLPRKKMLVDEILLFWKLASFFFYLNPRHARTFKSVPNYFCSFGPLFLRRYSQLSKNFCTSAVAQRYVVFDKFVDAVLRIKKHYRVDLKNQHAFVLSKVVPKIMLFKNPTVQVSVHT